MKTMIQLLLVMILFGGAAAGATFVWQKQQKELQTALQRAEAAEKKVTENPLAGMEKPKKQPDAVVEPAKEKPEPPVAARPPYVDGLDESSELVVSLNKRLRAAQEKERSLSDRQEAMKLIFMDIRSEQAAIAKRRPASSEDHHQPPQHEHEATKASQGEPDLHQETESTRQPLEEKEETAKPVTESAAPIPTAKVASDPAAMKRLVAIYDSMPAEVVAEVLQELTKQGRDGVVVELLRTMKDRQSAKVLAAIAATDAAKAASLTELLKHP